MLHGHITLPDLDTTLAVVSKWCIENNNNLIANHIFLIFKKFLHDNRINRSRIHIAALNNQLKSMEKVQQKLASKRQNGISSEKKMGSNLAITLIYHKIVFLVQVKNAASATWAGEGEILVWFF